MSPFDNLTNLQKTRLFSLLNIHTYIYQKNENMISTFKSENIIGIILRGSAKLVNSYYNGNEIILEILRKDSVFGTNISVINDRDSQLIANEETEIAVINYELLFNNQYINYSYFNRFINNLFKIISLKYKKTNEKLRVLSQKSIRDKLLEYFEIQYQKSHSRVIELPFTLKDLADYLVVNRTSMFRELKYLKEDRFIKTNGKKITLLYKDNLVIY